MTTKTLGALMALFFSWTILLTGTPADADPDVETLAAKTAGFERYEGFFTSFWDAAEGKLWLEIDRFEQEFLYVTYLSRGLGSNDVGLDRGQISDGRIVYFRRVGPKVLLVQPNYEFRADTDDADQKRAVLESFPQSVLWSFEVKAATGRAVLVDATDFFLADARDVVGTLRRSRQGSFRLDAARSAIDLARTRNFPLNTEVEAIVTFTADSAGAFVREVAPTPGAITLQQHHSLVALPEPGFELRADDPRAGFFGGEYRDFAAPLGQPLMRRYIARHRLEKKDPTGLSGEVKEPIVYYVDRGAPEPIRTALMEGAAWWNDAFNAAGFTDAYQVRLLPEGADPLDLRYNVIQWVHRSTRGWSYGGSVVDPRTGEILKGHITLGSLRARQDFLIAEGLLNPYGTDGPASDAMQQLALARLRQLAAHEVGHTLGLRHNYAASTNDRASVMDYPYPYVRLAADGSIDLSDAYSEGIGAWDKAAITYGYAEFAPGTDVSAALGRHLDSVAASGLLYLTDQDARSEGSAHPRAHLWDNGADAVAELERLLQLRAVLLERFSLAAIPQGTPLAMLEEALVPIYLFHRYQIEAAAKVLGGQDYAYSVRGSGESAVRPVAPAEQRRALEMLLVCVMPEALALPDTLLSLLPPNTTDYPRPREIFARRTGDSFDPLAAAESAADIAIRLILRPERAARLVQFHARDRAFPGLDEVLERLVSATWKAHHEKGYHGELRRTVDHLVLSHIIRLSLKEEAGIQARALARAAVAGLSGWIDRARKAEKDPWQLAHLDYAASEIERFMRDPGDFSPLDAVEAPAGSPIGTDPGLLECGRP